MTLTVAQHAKLDRIEKADEQARVVEVYAFAVIANGDTVHVPLIRYSDGRQHKLRPNGRLVRV